MTDVMLDQFVGAGFYAASSDTGSLQLRHALERLTEVIALAPADRHEQLTSYCARCIAAQVDRLAKELSLCL